MSQMDGPLRNVVGDREPPPAGYSQPDQLAGGASTTQVLAGLQGVITSLPSMMQEAMNTTAQAMVASQQAATFGGSAAQAAANAGVMAGGLTPEALEQAVTSGMMGAMGLFFGSMGDVGGTMRIRGMGPGTDTSRGPRQRHSQGSASVPEHGRADSPRSEAPSRPPSSHPGTSPTPRPSRGTGGDQGGAGGAPEGEVGSDTSDQSLTGRVRGGYALSDLRSDVGQWAGRHVSQMGARRGAQWQQGEDQVWRRSGPNGSVSMRTPGIVQEGDQWMQVGSPMTTASGETIFAGQARTPVSAATPEAQEAVGALGKYTTGQKVLGAGKGVIEGLGAGDLSGALGSVGIAGEVAAVPAAAYGIYREAGSRVAEQRAQNAAWQRITGGSNVSGFNERARQMAFSLSPGAAFGMGTGEASKLYMGTAELGLRGQEQQRATQFGEKAYNQFGMTVEETMQFLDTMSKTGQTSAESFTNLDKSLQAVTKSAQQAGENADVMRQNFQQVFAQVSETIGGPASSTIAASLTGVQSVSRSLQSVNQGGMLQGAPLYMMAANAGKTPGQFTVAARTGQGAPAGMTGSQFFAHAAQGLLQGVGGQMIGAEGQQAIASSMSRMGLKQGGHASQYQLEDIANQMEAQPGAMPADQVANMLQEFGVTGVKPENAYQYLASLQMGMGTPEQAESNAAAIGKPKTLTRGQAQAQLGQAKSSHQGHDPLGGTPLGGIFQRQSATDKAEQAYASFVAQGTKGAGGKMTYQSNPMLQAAAQNKDINNASFEVATSSGKRVVSFEDLMRNYSDQAQRGEVRIMSGAMSGQRLADVLGVSADQSVRVSSDTAKGKAATAGTAEDEWNRKHGQKSGGVVTINPSPALAQLLSISTQGNVQVANAANSLVPPTPFPTAEAFPGSTGLVGTGGTP